MRRLIVKFHNRLIVIKTALFILLFYSASLTVTAQFTITENFRNSNVSSDIKIGGDAYLTSGVVDPEGAGWLRLTPDENNKAGYAYIDRSFPSTMGMMMEFEYKTWNNVNNNSADGFTIFLFDADTPTFLVGASGGSLGYAPSTDPAAAPGHGLAGAYIGIAFDEYGNFVTNNEGRDGPVTSRQANSVVLRGPANHDTVYRYLDHIQLTGSNLIAYGSRTSTRPTDSQFYRRVKISIIPTGTETEPKYNITVEWAISPEGNYIKLIEFETRDPIPNRLKLGFAASTGGQFNNHEIRNLMVTTPDNLRINKRVNKDILRSVSTGSANQVTYTVEVINDSEQEYTNADFFDELVDIYGDPIPISMFTISSMTPSGFDAANISQVSGKNQITGDITIGMGKVGKVTVSGTLSAIPPANLLVNKAQVLPTGEQEDYDLGNNFATTLTPVIAEGVDPILNLFTPYGNCFDENGNRVNITVTNMGTANIQYDGYTRSGSSSTSRTYTRNRVELTVIIPPGVSIEGYDGVNFEGSDPNALWHVVEDNKNDPSIGYTTYIVKTRVPLTVSGSSISSKSYTDLGSGASLSSIELELKANFEFSVETKVRYIQEIGTVTRTGNSNSNYLWTFGEPTTTSDLEPENNRENNNSIIAITAVPDFPTVPNGGVIKYFIGEKADPLTATTDPGNSLIWYLSEDGVPSTIAPTPSTKQAGTTTYYVSQANSGGCEGPLAEIIVIVSLRNYWIGKAEGESDRHKWSDPTNWTAGFVPGAYEDVEFATEDNNGPAGDGNGEGAAKADLHLDNVDQQYSGGGLSGGRIINDLINKSGKDLWVTTNNQLYIDGVIHSDNTGGIIVKADNGGDNTSADPDNAKATGTLLFGKPNNNLNVTATVEFYNGAYQCDNCGFYKKQWQYFGIPVEEANFPYQAPQVETVNQWVEPYGNDNKWQPAPYSPDTKLKPFKGYEITDGTSQVPTHIYNFEGKLNLDDKEITLSKSADVTYSGVHILANSFTAAIPISEEAIEESDGLKEKTVYLFNRGTRDQWRKLNGGTVTGVASGQYTSVPIKLGGQADLPNQIPSMHSFLVRVDNNATIILKYDQLVKNVADVTNNQPAWRSTTSSTKSDYSPTPASNRDNQTGSTSAERHPYIIIDAIGEQSADRVWLFSVKGTTSGFDNGWDGRKMAESGLTQLYAQDDSGEEMFQVASVPNPDGLSIGFEPDGDGSSYELQFALSEHWAKEEIFLHDLKTGEQQRVVDGGSYKFKASKEDTAARFRLSYSGSGIFAQEIEESDIQTQTLGDGKIFIKNNSNNQCSIFISESESGNLLTHIEIEAGNEIVIENMQEGVYLIRIENDHLNDIRRLIVK